MRKIFRATPLFIVISGFVSIIVGAEELVHLEGRVVDDASGLPLPCRLYIKDQDGTWFLAKSAATEGSAVPYQKKRGTSVEVHTTLSAHPFVADLPPGSYTLMAERGKEYFPGEDTIALIGNSAQVTLKLRRWINMADRGWYSGDTHVHRGLDELLNVLLAEDLNVAFPLLYWVTEAFLAPNKDQEDPGAKLIQVDPTHVIYPRNTEYEIFTINKKRHTLGAVFLLNHQNIFVEGVPPVRKVAQETHQEGGLVELDKHAWPWSMILVPIMEVDLYELANNHLWRTDFLFKNWGEPAAAYMGVERDQDGWTERGWMEYGFQNYYTLLNCGFRLRPTAGTASGVHPVPLGFGRVYVHLPGGFEYKAWVQGLNEGRSFVTTGPMLFLEINGKKPGHVFQAGEGESFGLQITGEVISARPLQQIEVIVNGKVFHLLKPENETTREGARRSKLDWKLEILGPSWLAVRAFEERPGGRLSFAHSGPFYVEFKDQMLLPRKEEMEFLLRRISSEIERSSEILPPASLDEYKKALEIYQKIAESAR